MRPPLPPPPVVQLPPQLTDPATGDKLANVMQAMSRAFLNLPVGEVQAAVEGRPPTPADKQLDGARGRAPRRPKFRP